MPYAFNRISPFVLCCNLEPQIAFYVDYLGFRVASVERDRALLVRGTLPLHLTVADSDITGARANRTVYVDVSGIDALYAEFELRLRQLSAQRFCPPFNQDYGQREFQVIDEDGTLVTFGETVSQADSGQLSVCPNTLR